MLLKFIVVIWIVCLNFGNGSVLALNYDAIAQSVINFIQFKSKPTKINLLLGCWKNDDIYKFTKVLATNQLYAGIVSTTFGNTTNIEIVNSKTYTQRKEWKQMEMFVMDMDCYSSDKLPNSLLQFPNRWFIFISNISEFPKNLPIFTNSRLYLLQKSPPHILISPYKNINTTNYIFNQIAIFSSVDNTYSPILDLSDYQHRRNLGGLNINSTGVAIFPRTANYLLDYRFLLEDPLTKHNYLLQLHLMDIMNTTLNLSFAPGWGTKPPGSGQYNMLIGDLQKGISQIAGTISFMTTDRVEFVDYVGNPLITLAYFIFRAPPLSVVNNILTMPFALDVWTAIAMMILVIFVLMFVTVKWEWMALNFDDESSASILRPNVVDVVQLQIGAICQQGTEQEPKSIAGRIIMIFTFVSCLFFYTAYSANIVALLQSASSSITTLEDLYQSNIKLGADDMPYSKYFFSLQTDPLNVAIYKQKMSKPDDFMPTKIGVEKMRTEFYAFHSERDQIYKQMSKTYQEHEKCGLFEIKYLSQVEPYMLIAKNLPYKELVTIGYSLFKEHGLSNRMYRIMYAEKPKCSGSGGSLQSVGFNEIYFAIMIYAIGASGAVMLFLIENILKFKRFNSKLVLKKNFTSQ